MLKQPSHDSTKIEFVPLKRAGRLRTTFDYETADLIHHLLGRLTESKNGRLLEYIIESRFGLHGGRCSLEQIGLEFSLTRERIRQLEEKALERLRKWLNELTVPVPPEPQEVPLERLPHEIPWERILQTLAPRHNPDPQKVAQRYKHKRWAKRRSMSLKERQEQMKRRHG